MNTHSKDNMERIKLSRVKLQRPKKPVKNPLEKLKLSESLEDDATEELEVIQSEFQKSEFGKRMKNENDRFRVATDSEYWVNFIFQDREQKEVFLKALGLFEIGDKYIDGQEAAKKLGIELPKSPIKYNTSSKVDKSLAELVD